MRSILAAVRRVYTSPLSEMDCMRKVQLLLVGVVTHKYTTFASPQDDDAYGATRALFGQDGLAGFAYDNAQVRRLVELRYEDRMDQDAIA